MPGVGFKAYMTFSACRVECEGARISELKDIQGRVGHKKGSPLGTLNIRGGT